MLSSSSNPSSGSERVAFRDRWSSPRCSQNFHQLPSLLLSLTQIVAAKISGMEPAKLGPRAQAGKTSRPHTQGALLCRNPGRLPDHPPCMCKLASCSPACEDAQPSAPRSPPSGPARSLKLLLSSQPSIRARASRSCALCCAPFPQASGHLAPYLASAGPAYLPQRLELAGGGCTAAPLAPPSLAGGSTQNRGGGRFDRFV